MDAFADHQSAGNPAAVCVLSTARSEPEMQRVAAETHKPITTFCVPRSDGDWDLRWFTPTREIDLCGHGTLASAHVLLGAAPSIRFHTHSGLLVVARVRGLLEMDLPAVPVGQGVHDPVVIEALGGAVSQLLAVREVDGVRILLAELPDATAVRNLAAPDLQATKIMVTALADTDDVDFVSRYFASVRQGGEDSVTGSAHCTLAPFWAARLGRSTLRARQLSERGGSLRCTVAGDRVRIAGAAVTVSEGDEPHLLRAR